MARQKSLVEAGEEACSLALSSARKKYLGVFKTGTQCLCGGTIMDAANETPPCQTLSHRSQWREELDNFPLRIVHAYYCSKCGLSYRFVHKYKPLEVREPLPKAEEVTRNGIAAYFKPIAEQLRKNIDEGSA